MADRKTSDETFERAWLDVAGEVLDEHPGLELGEAISESELNRRARARVVELYGFCDHPGLPFDEEVSLVDKRLDKKRLS